MLADAVLQYDSAMQGQAQAAAAKGMALRYVGSLDFVNMKCTVELKVRGCAGCIQLLLIPLPTHDHSETWCMLLQH